MGRPGSKYGYGGKRAGPSFHYNHNIPAEVYVHNYQPYEAYAYNDPSPRRRTPSPPKRKSPSPKRKSPSPPKRKSPSPNAKIFALVSANIKAANIPVAQRRTLMNRLRAFLRRK